ncbi:MAG: manganese transporter [Chloroflexi bacterium]|nr:MAG: manganese transporter [Chloroflexota bacterium]
MKNLTTIPLIIILTIILAACGGEASTSTAKDSKLNVVATIGQIGDAAEIIGGDHVNVTSLMGAGVDPHLYTASESDVSKLTEADVILYNGLFLEAQMADVLKQIGETKTAVAVAEAIPEERLLASVDYADEHDPHVWFDVELWSIVVEAVRDTLIEADPDNSKAYQDNATAYLADLADLQTYVSEQAASVPDQQRVLITAHDAFNYFGRAYNFEVMGLQGISTESEASTADVQNLANFIVENQIPAIFVESSVPVRTVEAVQAAVADQGFNVEIGGELFSDAMGNPGTPEGHYTGMVRHNIDTIVGALLAK